MKVEEDEHNYEIIEICNTIGIFINFRLNRQVVPEGVFVYDLRYDEKGNFGSIENRVLANHAGTVVTRVPIDLPEKDGSIRYRILNDEDYNFTGGKTTLNEFVDCPIDELETTFVC